MGETGKKSRAKAGKNVKPSFGSRVKGFWKGVKGFWKGVKAEFKKVIWPTKDELGKQTAAVLIVSILLGAFIRLYDMVCQYVISFIR